MEDILGLVCFLLIVLIAVISSKRIQKTVGRISEWIVYVGLKTVILFISIIGIIIGLWILISWGWSKLHAIYPKMWSLGEIVGVALFFIIIGVSKVAIDNLDLKLKNRHGTEKVQGVYDGIGNIFKSIGIDICVLAFFGLIIGIASIVYVKYDYLFGKIYLWSFLLYLFARYMIVPISRYIVNRIRQQTIKP